MCYARGNAYLQLKEIDRAKSCFKEALKVDVKCYDVSYRKWGIQYIMSPLN